MKRILLFTLSFCFISYCFSQSKETKLLEKKDVEYAYPHWSGDGKSILYQSNESGRWQLYRMDATGRNSVQLTTDPANHNFPDWSPTNNRICYVSDASGDEEIFVMNADGKNQKQLTRSAGRDIHPYWSPKGDKIYFNSTRDNSNAFDIYEMNPDGSNVKRITKTSDDETCARLSPTTNKLVYLKNNMHGLDDVFVMSLEDHSEKNITNTPSTNGWPTWTPDGTKVLFAGIEKGRYKLFLLDVATGALKRISDPTAPYYDARPNISADGKKIVFNRQVDGEKNTIGIWVLEGT